MVKVIPRNGEEFEQTFKRFNHLVRKTRSRPWHKRRYGYYEKPSTIHAKQKRVQYWNRRGFSQMGIRKYPGTGLRLPIHFDKQFSREGPSNAMGR